MATQAELAEHLNLSVRRIKMLIKQGVIPSSFGPGGYDLDSARLGYIHWLRGRVKGQVKGEADEGNYSEDDYRRLLEAEKYREKKRQNDVEEEKLFTPDILCEAFESVAGQMVARLEALPLDMKRLNPKLSGHDIMTVKRAIADCRNAMADAKPIFDKKG